MQLKSRKPLVNLMIIGVIIWLAGIVSSGIYYFKVIANHDNFYSNPSPVPMFVFIFIGGLGFLLAVISTLIYFASLLKNRQ
ncbi:hypothetical protein BC351_34170 [Paenibacillus ferrarius]|uniref:Group-specific protein n=1 Tax=Paenibacillus ferrarius TaxID=1469647 RepID=A0A1V4HEB6_9BACL|nr:hypothetical protein BC351_34170 [Paenibacillus ferrarius]